MGLENTSTYNSHYTRIGLEFPLTHRSQRPHRSGVLVLTMLAVTAGKNPGFMEDYYIFLLNTSVLGQNLIPTVTNSGSDTSPTTCELVAHWVSCV